MLIDFDDCTNACDKTAALRRRSNQAWLPTIRPGRLALIHTCKRNNMVLLDNDGVRISSFIQLLMAILL